MQNKQLIFFNESGMQGGYEARYEMFEGRQHIVVPVTLLVEGVHHGSGGPTYYPPEELSQLPASWNGVPVPLGHPEVDGQYVSANSPAIIREWNVGRLFNVRYNEAKNALQGEIWADVELLNRRAPQALAAMAQGTPIEVSTGLFFDENATSGTWNGERYERIARNFRPDHLAILLDTVGACSVADGCGIRIHKKDRKEADTGMKSNRHALAAKGMFHKFFTTMAAGMGDIQAKLQQMLDNMDRTEPDGTRVIHWLEEAYDDGTLVLRQATVKPDETRMMAMYKTKYETDSNGLPTEISTEGWEPVQETRQFLPSTNKEEEMKTKPDANEETVEETEAVEEVVEETPVEEPTEEVEEEQPDPMGEALSALPPEVQAYVKDAIAVAEQAKQVMVDNVLSCPCNNLSADQLKSLPADVLSALNKSADMAKEMAANVEENPEQPKANSGEALAKPKVIDFGGASVPNTNGKPGGSTPMGRPSMDSLKRKKAK